MGSAGASSINATPPSCATPASGGSKGSGGGRKAEVVLVDTPPTIHGGSPAAAAITSSPEADNYPLMAAPACVVGADISAADMMPVAGLRNDKGSATEKNSRSIGRVGVRRGPSGEGRDDGPESKAANGKSSSTVAAKKELSYGAGARGPTGVGEEGSEVRANGFSSSSSSQAAAGNAERKSGEGGRDDGSPSVATDSAANANGSTSQDASGDAEGARNDDKIMEVCAWFSAKVPAFRLRVGAFFVRGCSLCVCLSAREHFSRVFRRIASISACSKVNEHLLLTCIFPQFCLYIL